MSKNHILYAALSGSPSPSGMQGLTPYSNEFISERERDAFRSVNFSDIPVSLAKRGVEGGNARGMHRRYSQSLCVLVYNPKGNFIKNIQT